MAQDIDDMPLQFGKHKGRTPYDIAVEDPGYIVWLHENVKPRVCTKALRDECEQDIREDEDEIYDNTFGWSGDF